MPSSPARSRSSAALAARIRAVPPPGTIPSSMAARVACRASSTRAFRSFISVSVAAPTLIWATPPASLARRSWSFSRSYSLSVVLISRRIASVRPLISSWVPLPSTIVVFSPEMVTLRARPRSVSWIDSSSMPEVLEDRLAAGQGGDVAEHGLAAVAVAGGLHGDDLEDPAELVDDQGRQGLALDVLGDDHQGLVGPGDLLEERDQDLGGADLLLVDQDVGVFEDDLHPVLVGDEVRAEVAPVELHPLDDVDGGLEPLAFFDGDHAVLADPLEGVGQLLADRLVVVGGDRGDLVDLLLGDGLGLALDVLDDGDDRLVDAPLQGHRIRAGGEGLQAFLEDRLGQDGGGGGAVAGGVGGLRGGLLDELGAHVFIRVGQLDLLGHGHAVLGDGRAAPPLVDHGVAAARAQCAPDGPGQLGDAARQLLAGLLIVGHHLRHGSILPRRARNTPDPPPPAKGDVAGAPRRPPDSGFAPSEGNNRTESSGKTFVSIRHRVADLGSSPIVPCVCLFGRILSRPGMIPRRLGPGRRGHSHSGPSAAGRLRA